MTHAPNCSIDIGKLCRDADRACAAGDLDQLRDVVHLLLPFVAEPLHRELAGLVTTCDRAPAFAAVAMWNQLKSRVYAVPNA